MAKEKGLSLKTTSALIIIVFLLGFGGTMMYYAFYKVAFIRTFDIHLETSEHNLLGFNADPTLHFGKVPMTGGISRKELNIWNDWDIPLRVEIRLKGEVAPFISVENNTFVLEPGETKKVSVYATVPPGFNRIGNFTGEAKVIYFRT